MRRLGIREADLEERFVRAGGPGGQHVNKTSTCVLLRHRPSGLEVRCEQERSQAQNRRLARLILVNRLEARRLHQAREAAARIAKLRRQKRKRSAGAKEAVLRTKRHRSAKKSLRSRLRDPDA